MRQVYVVVRYDHGLARFGDLPSCVSLTRAFHTTGEAEREVERMRTIKRGKDSTYEWNVVRLVESGSAGTTSGVACGSSRSEAARLAPETGRQPHPGRGLRHVYVVVRYDQGLANFGDLPSCVSLTNAFDTQPEAEREVERLTSINGGNGCTYEWRVARLVEPCPRTPQTPSW